VLDHPADQGAPFPGSFSVSTWAGARCDPPFRWYVGRQRLDDALTYVVWGPADETWTDGDRTIMCAVVSGSGAKLTDRVNAS
jgi:Septum formation